MATPQCPKVGTFPDTFSSLLPRGVPPVERPPTSFPVDVNQQATFGPKDVTWYFPINLGGAKTVTGVFIPQGFSFDQPEVDVILFFHGNKLGEFTWINEYWRGQLHKIALRDDLNASGKRAILVVPTLGQNPGHGLKQNPDLGIFGTPGMGTCFLDHVMQWLGNYDTHYTARKMIPKVRNVVLAGHSGGGNPIHVQMESMKAQVCEIWCFDVVYGDVSDWVSFAFYNPTKELTFYHAIQSLDSLQELIKLKTLTETGMGLTVQRSLSNLKIVKGATEHFACLTNNFGNHVKNITRCLPRP